MRILNHNVPSAQCVADDMARDPNVFNWRRAFTCHHCKSKLEAVAYDVIWNTTYSHNGYTSECPVCKTEKGWFAAFLPKKVRVYAKVRHQAERDRMRERMKDYTPPPIRPATEPKEPADAIHESMNRQG